MPSSALTDADDDLLAAVRAAEEAAAIKPNNVSDIDMDEQPESSGSEEDDLMKALREAEAAFGGTSFMTRPMRSLRRIPPLRLTRGRSFRTSSRLWNPRTALPPR